MNLLLFSDLHCSRNYAEKVVEKSEQADIVIGAGDFATVRQGLNQTINWLKIIKKPTLLVPGNNETLDELKESCIDWPAAILLHGNDVTLQNQPFFGIGGGIPVTPFGSWSYDFREDEAEKILLHCPEKAVLISHSPPKNYVDLSSRGQHLGSSAILNAIYRCEPRLVVCGHIHESAGKQAQLGNTTIINAGPDPFLYNLSQ